MGNKTITFIIPFVAKYSESQWQDRCAKLQQSLRSILNSSNKNFEVVIAGHDKPDFLLQGQERIHFVSVDSQRPDPVRKDVIEARADKLRKVAAAWNFAQANWDSDYVMKYDADDFISSKLVNWWRQMKSVLDSESPVGGFGKNLGGIGSNKKTNLIYPAELQSLSLQKMPICILM